MRLASRLFVAAVFAVLPRAAVAQNVAPAPGGLRTDPQASVALQYVAPPTGRPQDAGAAPGADPAPAVNATTGGTGADPAAVAAGPTLASATVGIKANTANDVREMDHHGGLGTGGALMIVGGAALIIGLIIGGSAGLVVAIAGAAVGLYGLFVFLQ